MEWIIGVIASFVVAGAAYKKKSLSRSGLLAATVVGTVLYALGSLAWFGTLIAFFVSSSFLTKWRQSQKQQAESHYEKTGRRDAGQVFANGGIGMLLCIANYVQPHELWWAAYLGVMATVTADTWATEIGGASKQKPRSILSGKRVPPGTSGGVTFAGLMASVLGSLFIALMAWLFTQTSPSYLMLLLPLCLISGFTGALVDSLLGATCQVMYRCQKCEREVEARVHCEQAAIHVRGCKYLNNDAVNLFSSLTGGSVAVIVAVLV